MRVLTLINGTWKQRITISLTNEEKLLRQNFEESKKQDKKALALKIKNNSLTNASANDSVSAQTIYDSNKIAGATLISVEIFLPNGNGIINCKVNKEHRQIRF